MAQNITKMAQNITKMALHDPKCPYMTPNGPETLPMGILHDIVSLWTTLGLFRGPLGPRWPLKSPQGGPIWHIIKYYVPEKCLRAIWSHAGTFWVMKGYFGS